MKRLLSALLALAAANVVGSTRPPAVAGGFYPADPDELRSLVESMLEESRLSASDVGAKALVVPHAGYVFSGKTAARAFASLPENGIRRVILLGPSHHVRFGGGALPREEVTAFVTPLGEVALDAEVLASLRSKDSFAGPSRAHDREHSLEVELPFLQLIAPEAKLVPIAVGGNTDAAASREMAKAIADFLDAGTVVIASSDFTHHGDRYGWSPYDGPELPNALLDIGHQTANRIAAIDPRGFRAQVAVSGDTVCGARPIEVLTELLDHAFSGSGRVLEVTTSGHVTGDFSLSVTYAAVAFEGGWHTWSADAEAGSKSLEAEEGQEIIELARAAMRSRLAHDASLARWFAEHDEGGRFLMPAGAFVTLNNTGRRVHAEGRLRACMGVIEAEQPLVEAVMRAAVWATQDPRFPAVKLDELDELEVEVSILSPARRVRSHRFIEVGKHGVVMSKDGRRAVYLPQVAVEQGWDRTTMLEHLSAKAGLPRSAWEHGASFEVFTAQVFGEHR
jgi:AmmeMemoRadiSam system protein B/AmmeMemoRadiSam system protein A